MENHFGIHLSFGKENVNNLISKIIRSGKVSYSCLVDINVLSIALKDNTYKNILDNSDLNICDGSFLAFLTNLKTNSKTHESYNGPELFRDYIKESKYSQIILGPSTEDFMFLKNTLSHTGHIRHIELPFLEISDFNYKKIAKNINNLKPDIIWVMLGAPKQELFIANISKEINSGLMIASGAALNFYLGRLKESNKSIYGLRFIWLKRVFKEPKKQIPRILKFARTLPKILKQL